MRSKLAIASFILGLLSMLLFFLITPIIPSLGTIFLYGLYILIVCSSLTAVIIGIMELKRIKLDNSLSGKGFAIAGVIVGVLAFLIQIALFILFIFIRRSGGLIPFL